MRWVGQLHHGALLGMVRFSENVQIIDCGPYPWTEASFEADRELIGGHAAMARGGWVTGRNIERLRGRLCRFTGYGAIGGQEKALGRDDSFSGWGAAVVRPIRHDFDTG